mmetsp:Transcript_60/g.178  ORF Transcript_60/g.178 Transcript_60/m.178 type:complete len:128 (-) Transcript_60:18-401(-)
MRSFVNLEYSIDGEVLLLGDAPISNCIAELLNDRTLANLVVVVVEKADDEGTERKIFTQAVIINAVVVTIESNRILLLFLEFIGIRCPIISTLVRVLLRFSKLVVDVTQVDRLVLESPPSILSIYNL